MSALGLGVTLLAQTARMAVPYVCAGLGGVWSERSGVVNIALEGILLTAGLAGVSAHLATGSACAGVVAGVLVGAAIGAAHATLVVRGRIDAIISGLAINLAAVGVTRIVLRTLYASSSNSPSIRGFPALPDALGISGGAGAGGASGAALLARTLFDPLTLASAGLVVWTAWALSRTRFGLRVRASGEDPTATQAAGVDVAPVRIAAVAIGGALAGLGGVALAYDQHRFQSGMSGGRGFIALAAVILSGWRPVRAAAACVAFAALDAAQIAVQGQAPQAQALAQVLPYVATLFALWVVARRRAGTQGAAGGASAGAGAGEGGAPAGLGRAPEEG